MQQADDRLVLVAACLEHERYDTEQVGGVRNESALAELLAVRLEGVAERSVEPLGQHACSDHRLPHLDHAVNVATGGDSSCRYGHLVPSASEKLRARLHIDAHGTGE